eukprot:1604703-Ditylum_brightwellii.AAC.2
MGDWSKDPQKASWKDSIFENYDKMNGAGAWSAPLLRRDLPANTIVLPLKLAFKVKLTNEENKYELYTQTCANGS